MTNLSVIMRSPCVEAKKRKFAGSNRPVWVIHRFPINGGISLRDTMRIDFARQRNTLFDMVKVMPS
jgi:hypothetical protein